MKNLSIIFIFILLSKCSFHNNKGNLLANDVNIYKNTPVWQIAKAVNVDDTLKIKQLLVNNSDSIINYQEKYFGQTLIEWAVHTNHYPSVKALAESGANPNIKSFDGTTAFIHAAEKFETSDYIRLLLKYGGDANTVSDNDTKLLTPLTAAAFSRFESVKLLVEAGAKIDYSKNNKNAILYACMNDKIETLNYLIIDKGADFKKAIGIISIDGDSSYVVNWLRDMTFPLESEKYKQKMKLVQYLLERGMNYWETPIPKHFYKNYDSSYLKKY